MNENRFNRIVDAVNKKRAAETERLRRHIEMGYINGKIHPNGMISYRTAPKGIQHWYDTRTLVKLVTEAFDRNETAIGKRICYINGKWQLQIRGKHLRRLLKAMPNVKQVGSILVEKNT